MLGAILGSIGTSAMDMLFADKQAEKSRNFSADMSSTAYQRGMADMRKAGLNPILASKIGGASTPSSAMAHASNLGANYNNSVATAQQGNQISAQVELIDAQASKVHEETRKVMADMQLSYKQQQLVQELASKAAAETSNLYKQGVMIDYDQITRKIISDWERNNKTAVVAKHVNIDGRSLRGTIIQILSNLFK